MLATSVYMHLDFQDGSEAHKVKVIRQRIGIALSRFMKANSDKKIKEGFATRIDSHFQDVEYRYQATKRG